MVELPPRDVQIATTSESRSLLRFTSTAANVGRGPLVVFSQRDLEANPFDSFQNVRLAGGGVRRYPAAVDVRYSTSDGHGHFHVVGFARYELRDANGRLVAADRKVGFCLGDRRLVDGGSESFPKRFDGACGKDVPNALRLTQGISRGWSDPYPADLSGQELDVTGLPAGIYQLVNHVNPAGTLRESDYRDNAAAVRISLDYPLGPTKPPTATVLATCWTAACP